MGSGGGGTTLAAITKCAPTSRTTRDGTLATKAPSAMRSERRSRVGKRRQAARHAYPPADGRVGKRQGLVRAQVRADRIEGNLRRAEARRTARTRPRREAPRARRFHGRRREGGDQQGSIQAPGRERAQRRADARTRRRVLVHELVQRPHAAGSVEAAHHGAERRARDVVDGDALSRGSGGARRERIPTRLHRPAPDRPCGGRRRASRAKARPSGSLPYSGGRAPRTPALEHPGTGRVVRNADLAPRCVDGLALQVLAGAVAEHRLDRPAGAAGRVERAGERASRSGCASRVAPRATYAGVMR